jgi:hypothetical protein
MAEFKTVSPEGQLSAGEMEAFKVANLKIALARVGEQL